MTLDEIVEETKKDYLPFFDFTWNVLREVCMKAGVDHCTDEMSNVRWAWNRVLKHEEEIRPIIEDCERILGRRV